MSTLDNYLPPTEVRQKQDPAVFVQENCSDCGKVLDGTEPGYHIRKDGVVKPYCRDCARKKLPKPKPEAVDEENPS